MGLDSSQACINFCFGYSVFLEAHLQAIINSLECWQNIQTCRQASDDTTLGKSSGSRPNSEKGGRERGVCSRESQGKWLLSLLPVSAPGSPTQTKGKAVGPLSHSHLIFSMKPSVMPTSEGTLRELKDQRKFLLGYLLILPSQQKGNQKGALPFIGERAEKE